jgi:hypothetical protein
MSYDTFVGVALDASIAGATWDSGDVTWSTSATTHLVGDGNGKVKIKSGATEVLHAAGWPEYRQRSYPVGHPRQWLCLEFRHNFWRTHCR